jgi:DNA adenine methylase
LSKLAALKWFGGKQNFCQKIIDLMPTHKFYVEPYCGGLGVLLNKPHENIAEICNDKNSHVINFFRVLQNDKLFVQFKRIIDFCPFSEAEFNKAREYFKTHKQDQTPNIYSSCLFFLYNRLSMGGQMKDFSPLTMSRLRGGRQADVNAFLNCIDGLPEISQRLRNVAFLCRDALSVINDYKNNEDALIYCDPPYLHETRTSKKVYEYEMSYAQHQELLDCFRGATCNIMLSGYRSNLYDKFFVNWNRVDIKVANSASHKKIKEIKTECIWKNF